MNIKQAKEQIKQASATPNIVKLIDVENGGKEIDGNLIKIDGN